MLCCLPSVPINRLCLLSMCAVFSLFLAGALKIDKVLSLFRALHSCDTMSIILLPILMVLTLTPALKWIIG